MSTLPQQIEEKAKRLSELKDEAAATNSWWLHQMYKLRPDLHEKQAARWSEIKDLEDELRSISAAVRGIVT